MSVDDEDALVDVSLENFGQKIYTKDKILNKSYKK